MVSIPTAHPEAASPRRSLPFYEDLGLHLILFLMGSFTLVLADIDHGGSISWKPSWAGWVILCWLVLLLLHGLVRWAADRASSRRRHAAPGFPASPSPSARR